MQVTTLPTPTHNDTARYAKCIEVSKVIRWDLERDLLRGRPADSKRPRQCQCNGRKHHPVNW